jgi:hypothetical protein
MKRWLITAGGGLMALTLILTGAYSTGLAQEEEVPPAGEEAFSVKDVYLEALATELGITVDELESAMTSAQMQAIDRWAEEAKDRVESGDVAFPHLGGAFGGFAADFGGDLPFRDFRPGAMIEPGVSIVVGPDNRGAELEGIAEFLGVSEGELQDDLRSGMSLVEIAEANGKTREEIRTYLIERATERIDEQLQESTSDGAETEVAPATPDTSA